MILKYSILQRVHLLRGISGSWVNPWASRNYLQYKEQLGSGCTTALLNSILYLKILSVSILKGFDFQLLLFQCSCPLSHFSLFSSLCLLQRDAHRGTNRQYGNNAKCGRNSISKHKHQKSLVIYLHVALQVVKRGGQAIRTCIFSCLTPRKAVS